ncbi:HGL179Cp [Eremothecium sinecaudum]|uniref:HGL179Cp n=1 Tax=Eremothecium sinecaudum TaxID=45286 RepID=A0A0X8HVA1_9SACH|nr:HGL179Cp [Eremothecium sinecaudum]AMD22161.1 HGL179Cp [Eremothecium sinecaudum]
MFGIFKRIKQRIADGEYVSVKGSLVHAIDEKEYNSILPITLLIDSQERKSYVRQDKPSLLCIWNGVQWPVDTIELVGTRMNLTFGGDQHANLITVSVTDDVKGLKSMFVNESMHVSNECVLISTSIPFRVKLERTIMLQRFENWSMHKTLTAMLLAIIGTRIHDTHLVMRGIYPFADWCYVFINDRWVKAWAYVRFSREQGKKNSTENTIQFFKTKSLSKKNLICSIDSSDFAEEVFFTRDTSTCDLSALKIDNLRAFLSEVDTIKYVGDVRVFTNDRKTRAFEYRGGSPDIEKLKVSKYSSSNNSTVSTIEVSEDSSPVRKVHGLLIRPLPHKGIHHLESLVRFILPIMDCLRLYGRPEGFLLDHKHQDSLLFGLPKLPITDYLAQEELKLLESESFNREHPQRQIKSFVCDQLKLDRSNLTFGIVHSMKEIASSLPSTAALSNTDF